MNIDPVAFRVGGYEIRWYGILIASAILIGLVLALREVHRYGENEDKFINMFLFVIPAAIIGARLYYVAFEWRYYVQFPSEIYKTWHGGMAIHGALIAGALVAWLFTRSQKVNFRLWADFVAPSVLLGQAIGRWGNFFNQEAYGVETSVPWAMYIAGAYRHPTFLYESLWDLAGFLILFFVLRKRRTFDGELVLWYALLYSSGRIWVEGLRTDSLMWGPIRVAQLVSAILIVLSIGLIVSGRRRAKAGQAQITLPPHE